MIKSKNTNFLITPTTAQILANKQKAFTLAETLITLTIIGIVTAMTLPNLIHKQQEHAMRVKFLKSINVVNHAHQLAWSQEELDLTPHISSNVSEYKSQDDEDLKKYYNIAKGPWTSSWGGAYTCLYGQYQCYGADGSPYKDAPKWKKPNGEEASLLNNTIKFFQLTDGTVIAYMWPGIYIDVNGPKGPNTYGKDIFILGSHNVYESRTNNLNIWGPYGSPSYTYNYSWAKNQTFDCNKKSLGLFCGFEIFKDINYKIPE